MRTDSLDGAAAVTESADLFRHVSAEKAAGALLGRNSSDTLDGWRIHPLSLVSSLLVERKKSDAADLDRVCKPNEGLTVAECP